MASPVPQRARVTRQDVARYAGVSSAVVSYVVNGGPKRVSPATTAKVLHAIQALGYRPNAAARALKLGSAEMLGLIVPATTNLFFAEWARSVEECAGELGYVLLTASSSSNLAKENRHLRNFTSRQVDGILLASALDEPDPTQFHEANIPVVVINRSHGLDGVPTIGVDFRTGAREGVQHLIDHGHRHIGLVVGHGAGHEPDDRELGWLEALSQAGLPEGPVIRAPFDREGGHSAGKRILSTERRPEAVFVSSDMQAVGVMRAAHEAGLSVPEDLAIVSFDGSPEAEYSWPPLTTAQQPVEAMARDAVTMLTSRNGAPPRAEHHSYSTELVIRRSCGCS